LTVDGLDDLVRSGRVNCKEGVQRLMERGDGKVNGEDISGSGKDGEGWPSKKVWRCCGDCSEDTNTDLSEWSGNCKDWLPRPGPPLGWLGGAGGSAPDSMYVYVLLRGLYDLVLVAGDCKKSSSPTSLSSLSSPSFSSPSSSRPLSSLDDFEAVEGCEPALCIIRSNELCLTAA